MKKKTRQVKAKRMWQLPARKGDPETIKPFGWGGTIPVFVLPATPEAWDAMLAQATVALEQSDNCDHREDVQTVFRALSLVRPTK